jgi:hypothetical protein
LDAAADWIASAGELPERVDLDELLRSVLRAQQPGEGFDLALERVVGEKFPDSRQALLRVIHTQLSQWQKARGGSLQSAAEELAKSQSELTRGHGGQPEISTEFRTETHIDLGNVRPDQRAEVLQHVKRMLESEGSHRDLQISTQVGERRIGCTWCLAVVTIIGCCGGLWWS